uniref:SDR family oxidoreductase n=1 Tax=Mycolicibacterium bacteremicum TaxID=564198 RepID=UPI003F588E3C
MTDKKLQGRAALVTGAASGNGAAIAERLCADGAQVWLADRNEEGLNATVANWPDELAARAHTVVFDVTDDNAIATAFGKLRKLDILVNNAPPHQSRRIAAPTGRLRQGHQHHIDGGPSPPRHRRSRTAALQLV